MNKYRVNDLISYNGCIFKILTISINGKFSDVICTNVVCINTPSEFKRGMHISGFSLDKPNIKKIGVI